MNFRCLTFALAAVLAVNGVVATAATTQESGRQKTVSPAVDVPANAVDPEYAKARAEQRKRVHWMLFVFVVIGLWFIIFGCLISQKGGHVPGPHYRGGGDGLGGARGEPPRTVRGSLRMP